MMTYPSSDMFKVTLVIVFQDIPQLILQVLSLIVSGWDSFTAINLAMSLILFLYMMLGKALRIYFSDLLNM